MSGFLRKSFIFLLSAVYLVGCGGSGVNDSGTTPNPDGSTTPPAKVITLKLVKVSDGTETTTISPSNPGKVLISVSNAAADELITVTTTTGTLEPANGSVLLASGKGEVVIRAGTTAGAGTLTATLKDGTNKPLNFGVGAANVKISALTIDNPTLAAGGQTNVSVMLQDESGAPFVEPTDVIFTSTCTTTTPATAKLDSPVKTVEGKANSSYTAQGCTGEDTITATATLGGSPLTASGKLTVAAAPLGSITFVSATPLNIALRGTGGPDRPELSKVVFKILDSQGNPVANKKVSFALDTKVGGLAVSPDVSQGELPAISDKDGLVTAVVRGGTIATPVKVTATVIDANIAARSDKLVVSSGVPTQTRFSIAATKLNVEAFNTDGVEVEFTARLADHFGNPSVGTSVSFRTETGGSIGSNCTTDADGACKVKWLSQGTRPQAGVAGETRTGRVTVLAYAIGEESFADKNSNGRFDKVEGDLFSSAGSADLGEVILDNNEDGVFNGSDEFIDFNSDDPSNNNTRPDAGDGKFNGVLCLANDSDANNSGLTPIPVPAVGQCTKNTLYISDSQVVGMATRSAKIKGAPNTPFGTPASALVLTANVPFPIEFTISDENGEAMADGSKVTCSTSKGVIEGQSTFDFLPGHNGGLPVTCNLKAAEAGTLTVEVTSSPSNQKTIFTKAFTIAP